MTLKIVLKQDNDTKQKEYNNMATKIEKLVKQQAILTSAFQNSYLRVVKSMIKKHGVDGSRDKIKEEMRKIIPKYIKEGLRIGVRWTNQE